MSKDCHVHTPIRFITKEIVMFYGEASHNMSSSQDQQGDDNHNDN
jgi:hypothetical protein